MTGLIKATRQLTAQSAFDALLPQAPDALLGLISLFRADQRPDKIDVGVGVYRNDQMETPVMRAVKAAEAKILSEQHSKSYLGPEGDGVYIDLLSKIVFGDGPVSTDCLTGVQTPGGTGALRLGAEFIARSRPDATIWIGAPTWPNHGPIFREAGLAVRMHPFHDPETSEIQFEAMMHSLNDARQGDVIVLHGCCHNPTGVSLTSSQWVQLAQLMDDNGLLPFVDLAYQGLGDGLEEDAAATRLLMSRLPEMLIAYSCDKNFGLYRERVGALWVQSSTSSISAVVRGNILSLARSLWSMPPDHGAAIVRVILDSPELAVDWRGELDDMRHRLKALRHALAVAHPALHSIAGQRGMFSMLPVSTEAVIAMREADGIYMAGNGRINIAGLSLGTIPVFVASIAKHLPSANGA